ncbi:EamA-like transporter family protein [Roseovarius sp. THAF8]|uniref:DMT family transporter n=1 Tax=Roseovarius sp. THAF8 TaxID=2587846 RepID=UPI0012682CF7|nr:DMT family transporter [Roseovarius sp. THAF8]QFT96292.1 EamA-like transporter family protein [Roseovarius sp. THAF8]
MTDSAHTPRAIGLLLYTGALLGAGLPLGKLAAAAGVPPLVWAMVISAGAAGVLVPVLVVQRRFALPRGRMLRYAAISGTLSFAAVNALLFWVIPHVGAGYAGLMFALSPVATLAVTAMAGLATPPRLGIIGIGLGLAGAALVALTRGGAIGTDGAGGLGWAVLGFALPAILAIGNVYRTLDWPEGAHPAALAAWSHIFALLALVTLQIALTGTMPLNHLHAVPHLVLPQMLIAGLTFPAYFALQRAGGPVLLSQIGYVAAAVGLAAGTVLLGEVYAPLTWAGAAVVAIGIALTIRAQLSPAPEVPRRAPSAGCA